MVDQRLSFLKQNQLNRELKEFKMHPNLWLLKNVGLKFYQLVDLLLLPNKILQTVNKEYKINHQQKKCHHLNHLSQAKVQK